MELHFDGKKWILCHDGRELLAFNSHATATMVLHLCAIDCEVLGYAQRVVEKPDDKEGVTFYEGKIPITSGD